MADIKVNGDQQDEPSVEGWEGRLHRGGQQRYPGNQEGFGSDSLKRTLAKLFSFSMQGLKSPATYFLPSRWNKGS